MLGRKGRHEGYSAFCCSGLRDVTFTIHHLITESVLHFVSAVIEVQPTVDFFHCHHKGSCCTDRAYVFLPLLEHCLVLHVVRCAVLQITSAQVHWGINDFNLPRTAFH